MIVTDDFWIEHGNQSVHVAVYHHKGKRSVFARKYVNHKDTPTLETWKGETEQGARSWASRVLGLPKGETPQ